MGAAAYAMHYRKMIAVKMMSVRFLGWDQSGKEQIRGGAAAPAPTLDPVATCVINISSALKLGGAYAICSGHYNNLLD